MKKSLLLLCLTLLGVTSCNTTEQQQPSNMKKSQPAKQNMPSCPKDDRCDPCDPCA